MKKVQDNNANEAFLADWLAGNLSDQELQQRVSDEDYKAYQKLRTSINVLRMPDPNMDANYSAIRRKISASSNRTKSKVRMLFPYVAIAASFLVLFGLYQIFAFSNSEVTEI